MTASRFTTDAAILAALCLSLAWGCASAGRNRGAARPSRPPAPGMFGSQDLRDESNISLPPIQSVSHREPHHDIESQPAFDSSASLEQLVSFALANNPELQAAHSQAHAVQERIAQARSLEDPMLMASPALVPNETADGPMTFMLSASQKLPWFGKLALRGEVAAHDADAAWSELAAVELRVLEQVKRAYFELYFVDRAITVNRELEPKLEQLIQVAEAKYETGAIDTGLESVLRARNELAKLQIMLAELQRAREESLADLAQTLHVPRGISVDARPQYAATPLPASQEELVALLEHCQPELAARRSELDRDWAAEALAQRDYFPDVTGGFQWQAMGAQGLSPLATGSDSYYLTLGVNLPVYRHRISAAAREARYNAARSAQRYDGAWDELRAGVYKLHAQAAEHDRVLELLDSQLVPQSEKTFTLSMDAYRVGRVNFEQLIASYRELLEYRIDLYRRQAQREQAVAALERIVGCAITATPPEADLLPMPVVTSP